ncbi:MAG: peptide chain release factor N(5)-glutamine methyltransferase [Rhodobacteraceae bacterium]|nr:peptide chain release factor N(5)-glutamine methyltransferase [Paracoccaceae bacterium]MBL6641107.1 peptide chain release factor N(5)-glutamine methyltransferase [Paracoccaceae bacterium]MBL6789975.1 peptide chain release factor N(5)-glutamine methyltransferase [Paracoccaceae bacterium]MBL6860528.1 peptide chain release factor N(5)-glutamine methyltransferase [Paracoccaceae bacterium]
MILRDLLALGQQKLKQAHIDTAGRDARLLAAAAMEINTAQVTLKALDHVSKQQQDHFESMIEQRRSFKPVSRILGKRQFWNRWFEISPDVLDPRGDSEVLVNLALQQKADRILDLGTGSGILALTLLSEWPDALAVGADICEKALLIAQRNAVQLEVSDRFQAQKSDWFEAISGQFDLIVSNPPYIGEDEIPHLDPDVRLYDPMIALSPGRDALQAYQNIARDAIGYLKPGGRLLVEIGFRQGEAVRELFASNGLKEIEIIQDLNGIDRVVCAIKAKFV